MKKPRACRGESHTTSFENHWPRDVVAGTANPERVRRSLQREAPCGKRRASAASLAIDCSQQREAPRGKRGASVVDVVGGLGAFQAVGVLVVIAAVCLPTRAGEKPSNEPTEKPAAPKIGNPFPDPYAGKKPGFVAAIEKSRHWKRSKKEMDLSQEKSFYTVAMIQEDQRAYALVAAAMKQEAEGQFRDALKIYQDLFDKLLSKRPSLLYRISKHGVFVPVSEFVQRRILRYPKEDLEHYRTIHDPRAQEAFEQAKRQYSLIGFSEVAGKMLATSYGDNALLELGNAALDTGHFLAALERFTTIRDFFPHSDCRTKELDLKIAYCRKMLGSKKADPRSGNGTKGAGAKHLTRFKQFIDSAKYEKPPFFIQRASTNHVSANDYTMWPPTRDPIALKTPVWKKNLAGSRRDYHVFTQPVVTDNSLIYRHKNIPYCRSLLNGELRWKNALGGRAKWQNWHRRQYPQEDVLVQDGLVFTPLFKVGPSLVALDEVTGQLRWAHGPIAASTEEEARMRFESAPTGGPRTIFASYILDNIDGQTHTDTEYGIMAFESATGRIQWRTRICRQQPGKFAGGFAKSVRNRIRSFSSSPLYHEGTVYYTSNAGAVAALDAQSGRVKWLMRYPYHRGVHDATRQFGKFGPIFGGTAYVRPHSPMFWLNQRPLLIGERLYVLPVNTPFMFCLNRRSGKVEWSRGKMGEGFTHLMGTTRKGELIFVTNGRAGSHGPVFGSSHKSGPPVFLIDPTTGKTVWTSPDFIMVDQQPVMKHYIYHSPAWFAINRRWFENGARPFLSSDDMLFITNWTDASIWWRPGIQVFHLAGLDLKNKKVVHQRRFYTDSLLAHADSIIRDGAKKDKATLEKLPHKDAKAKHRLKVMTEIVNDTMPVNRYGPFMPFSRVTFKRYGVDFELRFGPRELGMVYDKDAVRAALGKTSGPETDFAKAELALADARVDDAARLLKGCLKSISPEDQDFRAAINQQLYRVFKRLARKAIRAANPKDEFQSGLGMTRTAGTLEEELESMFALAEARGRVGDLEGASQTLRNIARRYGHVEYPVSPAAGTHGEKILQASMKVMDGANSLTKNTLYAKEMTRSISLLKKGLPLYLSTVSPVPKTLHVRAGDLAASRITRLRKKDDGFRQAFEKIAGEALDGKSVEEKRHRLSEFPGTATAQKILNAQFETIAKDQTPEGRKLLWLLSDIARSSDLKVPDAYRARVTAPAESTKAVALTQPMAERPYAPEGDAGTFWLALERRGDRSAHPQLLFLGGRVKKRLDNKFVLDCVDLKTGKRVWSTGSNIRLRGLGQEPGFFEAFVYGDLVVVHGLYDVLAFGIKDGKLRWRFRAPFNFEIEHAEMSGDVLVLAGQAETLALYLPTPNKNGEVIWQEKEEGNLYLKPYFHGDRLISVRKLPFNVTVRYRGTGRLIGRLALPDLTLHETHPLLAKGPRSVPFARQGDLLVLTDEWYYIALDVKTLTVRWKRLIDQNDVTRRPAMRLALNGDYLTAIKEDYDVKTIYMLSSRTGEVLWRTDPKNAKSPQPMHSVFIHEGKAYGIGVHPDQGFYMTCLDAKTGKLLYRREIKGYQAKPNVQLIPRLFGSHLVVKVQDRQEFELKVIDVKSGKPVHRVHLKGVGSFGVHGRVSATVQDGRVVLLSKDKMKL